MGLLDFLRRRRAVTELEVATRSLEEAQVALYHEVFEKCGVDIGSGAEKRLLVAVSSVMANTSLADKDGKLLEILNGSWIERCLALIEYSRGTAPSKGLRERIAGCIATEQDTSVLKVYAYLRGRPGNLREQTTASGDAHK